MSEILYPRSTIRRRLKEILSGSEAQCIDDVIEHVDVGRAYTRLPPQYKNVFLTLLENTEGEVDWEMMVMELQDDQVWVEETLAAAFNHLYSLLNPERG